MLYILLFFNYYINSLNYIFIKNIIIFHIKINLKVNVLKNMNCKLLTKLIIYFLIVNYCKNIKLKVKLPKL